MCSSPKSSGHSLHRTTTTGFTAGLSTDALNRFAAVANAADDRRQIRLQRQKERLQVSELVISQNNKQKNNWKYWLLEADLTLLFKGAISYS